MKCFMLVCLCLANYCQGQLFSISQDYNKVLYAGVANPLTIAVDNISSNNVIAKTDIGRLTGEKGQYSFYTDTGSVVHITLYKKGSNEKLGVVRFYVDPLPDPTPHVGAYKSGQIPSSILKAQPGISTDIHHIRRGLPIISFTVNIIRNGDYVFKEIKNLGDTFNEEVHKAFQQLRPGDSVVFNTIIAKRHDGTLAILSALTFTVK